MATTVLGLKTFTASDPVDYNEVNDNYNKIDNGVKTAMKGRAAHNWMDNSNFQINQRGKTIYNAAGYNIDRWYTNMGENATVTVGSGKITISKSAIGGSFRQALPVDLTGKTMTYAVKTANGVTCKSAVISSSSSFAQIDGVNAYLSVFAENGQTFFQIYFNDSSSITLDLYWAALYEGSYTADTLPAYQPKGYAAELAECQRYYYQSWDGSNFNKGYITREAISASSLALIEFPTEMRIVPTITFYTAANETGVVKEWTTSSSVSVTQNYTSTKAFGVSGEGNFTIGKTYFFHYTASADL